MGQADYEDDTDVHAKGDSPLATAAHRGSGRPTVGTPRRRLCCLLTAWYGRREAASI